MKKMTTLLSVVTAMILLFTNCERDNLIPDEQSSIEERPFYIPHSINFDYINKELRLGKNNFQVNWDDYEIINFNKETKTTTYEFDAYIKNEILNTSKPFVSDIFYKFIMTSDKTNSEYKILRFEPFKDSQNITLSSLNLTNFNGVKIVLNMKGKVNDILTYKNGMEIASFKTSVLDKQNNTSNNTLNKVASVCDMDSFYFDAIECEASGGYDGGGGFVLETTDHYTDWYTRVSDGNYYTYRWILLFVEQYSL